MRSPTRTLASTVLVFEALVVFFAGLVAKDLGPVAASTALLVTGGLALLCLLTAGLLRSRAGYAVGWALQGAIIATGFWVPVMVGVGAIFAALWVVGLRLGRRIERERAIVVAAGQDG